MLNKAMLLLSKKEKSPMFTVDLTELKPEHFKMALFAYDGDYIEIIDVGMKHAVENSRLDYVAQQMTFVADMHHKVMYGSSTIETNNVAYWTEASGVAQNFGTFYCAPIDTSKDAYIKFISP